MMTVRRDDAFGAEMETAAQKTPPMVYVLVSLMVGFVLAGSLMLWLERGPAILLDLSAMAAGFICF